MTSQAVSLHELKKIQKEAHKELFGGKSTKKAKAAKNEDEDGDETAVIADDAVGDQLRDT